MIQIYWREKLYKEYQYAFFKEHEILQLIFFSTINNTYGKKPKKVIFLIRKAHMVETKLINGVPFRVTLPDDIGNWTEEKNENNLYKWLFNYIRNKIEFWFKK